MKHYLTCCTIDNVKTAISWMQINIFGKAYCFSVKQKAIN